MGLLLGEPDNIPANIAINAQPDHLEAHLRRLSIHHTLFGLEDP